MKIFFPILFLLSSCLSSGSIVVQPIKPTPIPNPIGTDTVTVFKTIINTVFTTTDTTAKTFGAYGDGLHDDTNALQAYADWCTGGQMNNAGGQGLDSNSILQNTIIGKFIINNQPFGIKKQ